MGDELHDLFHEALPDGESLAGQQARAALGARLFGLTPEPVKLARYVILGRLGEGGMGVVYSAYDPELDRKVAIKVLRSGPDSAETARLRLQREAQALARLSHPNVVPVHDVGVLDGRVFIVMEFVRGRTLRRWVEDDAPGPRQIVDAYVQAGHGLAAAHDVGLVHRDFKPDNALMGEDGRVRVVDFGLVRARGDHPPAAARTRPASTHDAPEPRQDTAPDQRQDIRGTDDTLPAAAGGQDALTATGALMGTPAYMSPEQLDRDAEVGPATDQYSLCVSLYEALHGARPFADDTLDELLRAAQSKVHRPLPRSSRIPGWLYKVSSRGMAADPAARYPDMHALIAALRRDPARKRRRILAVAVLGAVLLGLSYQALRPGPTQCGGAAAELASVWNTRRRAAVEQALLGTNTPYAREAWPLVSEALDRYGRDWVAMHESACLAHARGHQSSELFDRRIACLDQRRSALDSAAAVLTELGAESLAKAVEVTAKLPSIDHCGQVQALLADVPPPIDPELARQVAELRDRAVRAKVLEDAGRYDEALQRVTAAAAEAEPLGYEPVLAELLLARGRIVMQGNDPGTAEGPLRRAAELGLSAGMDALSVEALARLIYTVSTSRGPGDDLAAYLTLAEALGRRVPDRFARALLLNNAGSMHLSAGDRKQARAYFVRALEVRDRGGGNDDLELEFITSNLALVTEDDGQREALLARVVASMERRLGATHPITLGKQLDLGHLVRDPEKAHAITVPACAALERYHPHALRPIEWCVHHLGVLEAELGNSQRAAETFEHLAEVLAGRPDSVVSRLARGYGSLYRGDARAAREPLEEVIADPALAGELPWWQQKHLARARLGLGASELALDRPAQAAAHLEQVVPMYEALTHVNEDMEFGRHLAWARWLLARALWQMSSDIERAGALRERVMALLSQAEAWYRGAEHGYHARLAELAAWRGAHGL